MADDFQTFILDTARGQVETRLYDAPGARAAALMAGGVGGGFDTPARGLYPRLARELVPHGIASLRLRYRYSTELAEAVYDVLAGISFLEQRGVERVGLVGHSLGGAVMIAAGAIAPTVKAVVGLASQSYGAGAASRLAPRALLLIHGTADTILPSSCSVSIHRNSGEPRALELLEGAGHMLDEDAERVFTLTRDWLLRYLGPTGAR